MFTSYEKDTIFHILQLWPNLIATIPIRPNLVIEAEKDSVIKQGITIVIIPLLE